MRTKPLRVMYYILWALSLHSLQSQKICCPVSSEEVERGKLAQVRACGELVSSRQAASGWEPRSVQLWRLCSRRTWCFPSRVNMFTGARPRASGEREHPNWSPMGKRIIRLGHVFPVECCVIKSGEEFLLTGEDAYVIMLSEICFYKVIETWLKGNILQKVSYVIKV